MSFNDRFSFVEDSFLDEWFKNPKKFLTPQEWEDVDWAVWVSSDYVREKTFDSLMKTNLDVGFTHEQAEQIATQNTADFIIAQNIKLWQSYEEDKSVGLVDWEYPKSVFQTIGFSDKTRFSSWRINAYEEKSFSVIKKWWEILRKPDYGIDRGIDYWKSPHPLIIWERGKTKFKLDNIL